MANSPAPVCLDLTRLVSRHGRGPWTGIDRVEAAYLAHLLGNPGRAPFGLVRQTGRYFLLERDGLSSLSRRLRSAAGSTDACSNPVAPDLAIPALAVDTARRAGLARMLRRRFPCRITYLNVAHSNLGKPTLSAFHRLPNARIVVLLHDIIPLEHPAFQVPRSVRRFRRDIGRVARTADAVIANSADTARRLGKALAAEGRRPDICVAHLGVDGRDGQPVRPGGLPPIDAPFFLCLGTIEPRKNHALLLDIWDRMHTERPTRDIPHLVIAGHRGWLNDALIRRLESHPLARIRLHELSGPGDREVDWLFAHTAGVLFPSLAEGFGLPAAEAAAAGAPLICSTLPVFREVLGDYPICLDPTDTAAWHDAIIRLASNPTRHHPPRDLPDWKAHFNKVLSIL